jgi:hypothetical protein
MGNMLYGAGTKKATPRNGEWLEWRGRPIAPNNGIGNPWSVAPIISENVSGGSLR